MNKSNLVNKPSFASSYSRKVKNSFRMSIKSYLDNQSSMKNRQISTALPPKRKNNKRPNTSFRPSLDQSSTSNIREKERCDPKIKSSIRLSTRFNSARSVTNTRRQSLVSNTRRRTLQSGVSRNSEQYVCIVENRARQIGLCSFSMFTGTIIMTEVS